MNIKWYRTTFNSKGKYTFEEVKEEEGVEILVKKDNYEYEESTGCWYPRKSSSESA